MPWDGEGYAPLSNPHPRSSAIPWLQLPNASVHACLVDPSSVSSLMACRLMALNKNPGVRPIGICETVRRIISKAILSVTKGDIQDAVGTTQLCAGQIAGIETGIHSVRDLFNKKETEGVLLVDASNAFNSLNRQTALQNARRLCPSLATMLINTYREPTDLFVDGDVLSSKEGTTQGDPLTMPMYAIATAPLIQKLNADVTQIWYADDASLALDLAISLMQSKPGL